MATFSVAFLGCKVSQTDAHAVRERLLVDGHEELPGTADVAVVNTCCVTHEAVRKSRRAVARAARTHGRVYVTGCAANLAGALRGLAENVVVVRRLSEDTGRSRRRRRGDGCVRAEARLERPGLRADQTRRFSAVLRDSRFVALAQTAASAVLAETIAAARRARRGRPPGINRLYPTAAGYDLPGSWGGGATPGLAPGLSSIEVNHVGPES